MKEKNTYKCQVKIGRRIIAREITQDWVRLEATYQANHPDSRIELIGRKTTHEAALKWQRQNGKRPYNKRGSIDNHKINLNIDEALLILLLISHYFSTENFKVKNNIIVEELREVKLARKITKNFPSLQSQLKLTLEGK